MNEVLAIGLQSMQADSTRLDQAAMNIANVLTPGYKRAMALQSPVSFGALMEPAGAAATLPVQLHTDLRAGTLRATGQPLDFSIAGSGFFEVMTPEGPVFTRRGNFQLDARGRLVTAQGHPVMGRNGELSSNALGAMDSIAAELKVVDFDANAQPTGIGDGNFAGGTGQRVLTTQEAQVRQGFLENSNVNSAQEMTSVVMTMRHFESMQRVMQGYEEMLGTAVRKLGETS